MAKKLTKEEFIESVKKVHGDSIDLSEAEYVKDNEKVKCRCNTCNTIWFATPNNLKNGRGCPRCSHRSTKYTLEEWKSMVTAKYGNKYDLSEVREYNGRKHPMKVICHNKFDNGNEHGIFYMSAKSILDGRNCPHCSMELSIKANESKKMTPDELEKRASGVHDKKYTYHGDYVNARTKVRITCPIHGDFYQLPRKHLKGQGCPKCNSSHLEIELSKFLDENGIDYKQFYRSRWLGLQNLDFYLPKYNIGIECQGIQHYEPISFSGDKSDDTKNKNFEVIKARDAYKKDKCLKNNVKLLYFTHCGNVNEDETTFKDKNKMLNEILKNGL